MGGDVRGKAIAVLGLTFKPNTDDMRDSPAISIIQTLLDGGATVTGYDPEGMDNARQVIDNIVYADDAYGGGARRSTLSSSSPNGTSSARSTSAG